MRKVLVDANVVLDVLVERQPFLEAGIEVWRTVEDRVVEGYLSAHTVTTIAYVARKTHGSAAARQMIEGLLRVFRVAPVNDEILDRAVRAPMPDFEDAVTAEAAHYSGCELIVTRDPAGFRGSRVRSLIPAAFLATLKT